MTDDERHPDELYERLIEKYGYVMNIREIAEVFKYPSESAARQANAAGTLPVRLKKWPGRRELFTTTREVADAIEELEPPPRKGPS